jgi:hypothetical protein
MRDYLDMPGSIGGTDMYEYDKSISARVRIRYHVLIWRYFWSYPDELLYLQGMQYLLEAPREASTNDCWLTAINKTSAQIDALKISDDEFSAIFQDPSTRNFHYVLSSSVMSLAGVFRQALRAEAASRIAMTAIALKRYQQKHGSYPQELGLLVPDFLTAVSNDPVDGKPLRYRLQADGTFLLYSIGENGIDDGGDAALAKDATSASTDWLNRKALDWVWPQPATQAEIDKYNSDQAHKSN